jgi:hypothetical protein
MLIAERFAGLSYLQKNLPSEARDPLFGDDGLHRAHTPVNGHNWLPLRDADSLRGVGVHRSWLSIDLREKGMCLHFQV